MRDRLRVELHMLQNFAPSCLNRDDTNSPKDCRFGGVRRARISSQCLKRAMRRHEVFQRTLGRELGVGTKRLRGELVDCLKKAGRAEADAQRAVDRLLPEVIAGLSTEDPKETDVRVFVGLEEVRLIVEALAEHWDALSKPQEEQKPEEQQNAGGGRKRKAKRKAACDVPFGGIAQRVYDQLKPPDIALFGRMMATQPQGKVDAACQVGHAISTHKVDMEMDFFSAVEELEREDPGAAMIGVTGFNSACFYRYALVDVNQLARNLKDDEALALQTVEAFIRAARVAIPSGKQNSMAAQNPPSLILSVVRQGGAPCSLANAFARPVWPGNSEDLVGESIRRLDAYWGRMVDAYGDGDVVARPVLVCHEGAELDRLKGEDVADLPALVTDGKELRGFEKLVRLTMRALQNGGE